MNEWVEQISIDTERFINELVGIGFTYSEDAGAEASHKATLIDAERSLCVAIKTSFPYTPPDVWLMDIDVSASWHANPNGSLCLYPANEFGRREWMDVSSFLQRIEEWRRRDEDAWVGDTPQLDAERYLHLHMDDCLVIYGDEIADPGACFELRKEYGVIRSIPDSRLRSVMKRSPSKKRRRLIGLVTSVGELEKPLRTWDDILKFSTDRELVERMWNRKEFDVLLVGYSRLGHAGAFAIVVTRAGPAQERQMRKASAASMSTRALTLRAQALDIGDQSVCLVGTGAIGSHLADLLVRAGVGHLTLWDGDTLLPGNAVRYLVTDPASFGRSKVSVIGSYLESRPFSRTEVSVVEQHVSTPSDVVQLLQTHDLVVDATGDSQATQMLIDAAEHLGGHIVSVCTQNEGTVIRVDIIPPLGDEKPIPPTTLVPPSGDQVFESGCGDPLSLTPPHAVAEAAAIATRHIVGFLTKAVVSEVGEARQVQR